MVAWQCEVKIAFSRTFLLEITNSFVVKDIYVPELLPYRLVPVEQPVGVFKRMHVSHGRVALFGQNGA